MMMQKTTNRRPEELYEMTINMIWFGFLFLLINVVSISTGFNVDLDTAVIYKGPLPGSMFGFTVAQYSYLGETRVLVGAPEAQTSQAGVTRGGAVYNCGLTSRTRCELVRFDTSGNQRVLNVQTEEKSNQWFGATLYAGDEGHVVICSPRYIYFTTAGDKRLQIGNCYLSSELDGSRPLVYYPCKKDVDASNGAPPDHQDRLGRCAAGFSAVLSLQGKRLLIGAVGSWFWQGQVYNYVVSSNRVDDEQNYVASRQLNLDHDTLLGFSSTVGKFIKNELDIYAVGAPKANDLKGKVVLYTVGLEIVTTVSGDQIGSYFGYSVAAGDFNGDGQDDLAVGAPFHYDDDSPVTTTDRGSVYVFYSKERELPDETKHKLNGKTIRGRFGLSLARMNDINKDNYDDLAVGAPYGGDDGQGAVFIYHGSKQGIIAKPKQVIHGKRIDAGLKTFGYSLSAGKDMDDNFYPDLVVGAYKSDQAVLFKSRPIVNVIAIHKMDNTQDVQCDGVTISCFVTCLEYSGVGVPNTLAFDQKWNIDADNEQGPRAYYMVGVTRAVERTKTRSYQKNKRECDFRKVYLRNTDEFRDKLTPIVSKFKYGLNQDALGSIVGVKPIVDIYSPNPVTAQMHIIKDCGPDNVCIPDLRLSAIYSPDIYILGTGDKVNLTIFVENPLEGAYETMLYVNLTGRLEFNKVYFPGQESPTASCDIDRSSTSSILIECDLGNPFPQNSNIKIVVQVTPKHSATDRVIIYTVVNSTNAESSGSIFDNEKHLQIPITARAEIVLTGGPLPEQVGYSSENLTKRLDFKHIYDLRNFGPSDTGSTLLEILWPSHDVADDVIFPVNGTSISGADGLCKVVFIAPRNSLVKLFSERFWDEDLKVEDEKSDELVLQPCGGSLCTLIQCEIKYMKSDSHVIVNVFASASPEDLKKKFSDRLIYLLSIARAKVTTMAYNITMDTISMPSSSYNVYSSFIAEDVVPPPEKIQVWIIIVAVIFGVLLLIIIVVLLWKFGFFKRKRPEGDTHEKEPLHDEKSNNIEDNDS